MTSIKHFAQQNNLVEFEGKLYAEIPQEVSKLLHWKAKDRVQVTLSENGMVQFRNFDSTVQDSFKKLKDDIRTEVSDVLPKGYSIRSFRELQSTEGYEISVDKPSAIRHSDLQEFVNKVNQIAKNHKLRIEII